MKYIPYNQYAYPFKKQSVLRNQFRFGPFLRVKKVEQNNLTLATLKIEDESVVWKQYRDHIRVIVVKNDQFLKVKESLDPEIENWEGFVKKEELENVSQMEQKELEEWL